MPRHFLKLSDLKADEIYGLIQRAVELKEQWRAHRTCPQIMKNRTLALVFDKASTRTRVSFEIATHHFGGNALFLSSSDSQRKRGESVADTARVVSSMADLIVIRTGAHSTAETYVLNSSVPVINGLSDDYHPCQLLADLLTLYEVRGSVEGSVVAWIGDGNNMCVTWASAAYLLGFQLRISTPPSYAPSAALLNEFRCDCIKYVDDPLEAVQNSDVVVTDTWSSMGHESEKKERAVAFESFRVTEGMMKQAKADAIFMHCLPAYRGLEVESAVIDGPQSVVWAEAENRLHAQKSLIELLLR